MAAIPATELAWLRDFVSRQRWVFASTYADTAPHEYVVRDKMPVVERSQWDHFCELIVSFGHIENYYRTTRPYLYLDGWKYWNIEDVLNRADDGKLYGEQWSARTASDRPATAWDFLAPRWDAQNPPQVKDDERTAMNDLLWRTAVRGALDVNCRTGNLLGVRFVRPSGYLGLDPSSGMLNRHVVKYPKHLVEPATLIEYSEQPSAHPWPLVSALWGAADYLTVDEIEMADMLADEALVLCFHGPNQRLPVPMQRTARAAASTLPGRWLMLGRWEVFVRDETLY